MAKLELNEIDFDEEEIFEEIDIIEEDGDGLLLEFGGDKCKTLIEEEINDISFAAKSIKIHFFEADKVDDVFVSIKDLYNGVIQIVLEGNLDEFYVGALIPKGYVLLKKCVDSKGMIKWEEKSKWKESIHSLLMSCSNDYRMTSIRNMQSKLSTK